MDLTGYNTSNEPLPDEGGGRIPDGTYPAEIIGFKVGNYASGGDYVEFEYELIGDSHAGRRAWQKTTLMHDDPDGS